MDMKIRDTGRTGKVDKKKKTGKSAETGSTSFASLLESAGSLEEVSSTSATTALTPNRPFVGDEQDDLPRDARGRGAWMLEKLDELQRDILAGDPTEAAAKLQHALETEAIDREDLPEHLRHLVDEIDLRASVEIAKLDVGRKKSK